MKKILGTYRERNYAFALPFALAVCLSAMCFMMTQYNDVIELSEKVCFWIGFSLMFFGTIFSVVGFIKFWRQLYWFASFKNDKVEVKRLFKKKFTMLYKEVSYVGVVVDKPNSLISDENYVGIYMSLVPIGKAFQENLNELDMTEQTIKFYAKKSEIDFLTQLLPQNLCEILKNNLIIIQNSGVL